MATAPFTCFAIAAPGLEPIVAKELTELGEQPRIEDGGVSWEGDALSVMRANLWLRSASRVVVRVARFKATAFFELEKHAKRIPWERFVASRGSAEFRVTARKSRLYHSDAIAERLGNSVAARVSGGAADSRRPTADRGQLFIVRVLHDEFEISADTSGELLHMRGYRLAVGKAPLRETLAAALLLSEQWTGATPLLDPFCGSGTIPIEGAMIARQIAPGLHRHFAFMRWPEFDERAWRQTRDRARSAQKNKAPFPIMGSDRDAGAIESAHANAARAGVDSDIELSVRPVSAIEPPAQTLVATNPPYGVRASAESDIRNLYAQLGKVLRATNPDGRLVMLLPDRKLARQLGFGSVEVFKTSNGGIKVAAISAAIPPRGTTARAERGAK